MNQINLTWRLLEVIVRANETFYATTPLKNTEVVQEGNDMKQLAPMVNVAKEALETQELEVLADAGYCNGDHLKECEESGVEAYVPIINRGRRSKLIGKDRFAYDEGSDSYRCPEGKELSRRGTVKQNGKNHVRYRSLKTDCDDCPLRELCLGEKSKTRQVLRWEHEKVMERHAEKMKGAGEKMRKRGFFGGASVWHDKGQEWSQGVFNARVREVSGGIQFDGAWIQLHSCAEDSRSGGVYGVLRPKDGELCGNGVKGGGKVRKTGVLGKNTKIF